MSSYDGSSRSRERGLRRFMLRVRLFLTAGAKTFGTGLMVFFPLIVTFLVLNFVFKSVESLFVWLFGLTNSVEATAGIMLFTVSLVFYGGYKIRRQEKWFMTRVDRFLAALPMVGAWYKVMRDLVDRLTNKDSKEMYLGVVEVPVGDGHVLAFVTKREVWKDGRVMLTLFMPTSPNPTSGIVLFFPEDKVKKSDLPAEAAFSRIISLGIK
ncbi:hypothetical protein TheveDRAFT_1373 [Thermanaerovibrio velox DSM 12556]|uniref:DUF502 domain-containing protein n=1 Tax=Thermanaerovibrio velox DSM 12556 TaxID=926567 RepID=H0UNY9_9BACT|nr:DUF502 domain-containing protein [Thermanaerovibrio velox]EHM10492.1 hypothetical protein TheveDRAFT_1373 [Thermanaerovibrio velox DSM 12556]